MTVMSVSLPLYNPISVGITCSIRFCYSFTFPCMQSLWFCNTIMCLLSAAIIHVCRSGTRS